MSPAATTGTTCCGDTKDGFATSRKSETGRTISRLIRLGPFDARPPGVGLMIFGQSLENQGELTAQVRNTADGRKDAQRTVRREWGGAVSILWIP